MSFSNMDFTAVNFQDETYPQPTNDERQDAGPKDEADGEPDGTGLRGGKLDGGRVHHSS